MRVVFISDTHNRRPEAIPEGDLLIHAGDLTGRGEMKEIRKAGQWLRSLPHKYKVVIAGNHDWMFQRNPPMALSLLNEGTSDLIYLEDSMTEIEGLKIYGSPQTPSFFSWAFNVDRGEAIKHYWDRIPEGLDILITHGPPMGILDQSYPHLGSEHLGCEELMLAVERTKPKFHVFGHIHGGHGKSVHVNTTFINAAICDEQYQPRNPAHVIDL